MTRLDTLNQLADKYPTDKKLHGYLPHYAELLPDKCSALLEIGAAKGYSLQLWNEFYGPDQVDIHTIDLFGNPEFVSTRWCRNQGFVPHRGNQSSILFLALIHDKFDVIIDDGSHNAYDQIASFRHLFINNLAPGGLYIIEDCHCCLDKFYWGRGVDKFEDTILACIENYCAGGDISNKFISDGEREMLLSLIDYAQVRCDRKMIFIRKN